MKKTMINYKKMAVAMATVLTMGFSNAAFATGDPVEPKAGLTFTGSYNKLPIFQLVLNNSTATEYTVIVKDNEKTVLLREVLKGTNITRRYKLDVEELSYADGTTFEVTNKLNNETTVYKINSTNYVVENVVIAKL